MLSRLKGELVRTVFLPDWKVKVTEGGRRRLRCLMSPTPEQRLGQKKQEATPHVIRMPDGTELVLKERVHQAFYDTVPTKVPGVFVRRSR